MNPYPLTLLYIEDDEDIQTIYLDYIQTLIKTIHCAKDGEEGYQLYLETKPDIILLDINMPKLDGLSLARKIREVDKEIKIIITTSHAQQDKLLQAIELYLVKYILKPIDPKILKEALLKAISEIEEHQSQLKNRVFLLDAEVRWNTKEERLTKNNIEIQLTKNERRLLSLLSSDKSRVFSFFEIFDHLSYDDFDKEYDANQIRALVKLIRKKIPKESIINVYGEGYRFNPLK